MKKILTAIMIVLATAPGLIILFAAPGHAQFKRGKEEAPAAPKKQDDGQYKAAIDRMPEKKFDPWANMR